MRRLGSAVLAAALALGMQTPASAQVCTFACPNNPPPPPATTHPLPPLGWYAVGSIGCAAVSPILGTAILGRALTLSEAYHTTLGCFLGPAGWLLADLLMSLPGAQAVPPPQQAPPPTRGTGRGTIDVPPPSIVAFVPGELLLEVNAGAEARLAALARRLDLTLLETQSFALTGRTLQRWRINGPRAVRATLQAIGRAGVAARAQPNYLYGLSQQAAASTADGAQYVVSKLHLLEAHRISTGEDVLVAVIDSKIDTAHPDLAGVFAGENDVIGTAGPPHPHGTAMAGAIAAHGRLVGVAPRVRLLAVRAFSGTDDSAQGTTFNILKGFDWAASRGARVVNMSFAGPPDPMLHEMISRAHARGMVLVAAVGNAGPRSPPLYPAAYAEVIGVTATDADDRLLPQANRGPQVALAAPGVDVLADAPEGRFQLTSGTSVASAHVSGVAALVLARDPALSPAELRRRLIAAARPLPGMRRDVGAGVVDALRALREAR
jgi:subtilisin family serine protease